MLIRLKRPPEFCNTIRAIADIKAHSLAVGQDAQPTFA
jgi:hypothetical protein